MTKTSFKTKTSVTTFKPLKLLHLDLFGPTTPQSLGGKKYGFVIVDDFLRFSWILFLARKSEALDAFSNFTKKVQNQQGLIICSIRSDHGTKFENLKFENFCNEFGITHYFSSPYTPQQNEVVERKNRTLIEMGRTLICDAKIAQFF